MLIFGRSPNLVLGALTALFNVGVAFHVNGFAPDVEQIAVVNLALGSLVALVANSASTAIAAGAAATMRANGHK